MNPSRTRLLFVFGALLLAAAAAFTAAPGTTLAADRADKAPAPEVVAWPTYGCNYIVGDFDDLFSISLRFGVPYYQMMMVNGLYTPYMMYGGMSLQVPCMNPYPSSNYQPRPYSPPSMYPSSNYGQPSYSPSMYGTAAYGRVCFYHVVFFGEYLRLIARRFGVSWLAIAAMNHMYNPNLLFVGTRLAIPCPAGANPYGGMNPYGGGMNPYGQPAPTAVPGQGTNVTIQDFMFSPGTIMVHVGQTVTWRNNGPSSHTTTSDTGIWNSGTLGVGATFSQTFNSTGSFPYHCMIHPSMHGTVVVMP